MGLMYPGSRVRAPDGAHSTLVSASLAQLGERQTEDLKVPGSIPGGGTPYYSTQYGFGLVGYDDCLTHSRSRVRISEPVYSTQWGISSIGRARRLQRRGTGIEARILQA